MSTTPIVSIGGRRAGLTCASGCTASGRPPAGRRRDGCPPGRRRGACRPGGTRSGDGAVLTVARPRGLGGSAANQSSTSWRVHRLRAKPARGRGSRRGGCTRGRCLPRGGRRPRRARWSRSGPAGRCSADCRSEPRRARQSPGRSMSHRSRPSRRSRGSAHPAWDAARPPPGGIRGNLAGAVRTCRSEAVVPPSIRCRSTSRTLPAKMDADDCRWKSRLTCDYAVGHGWPMRGLNESSAD